MIFHKCGKIDEPKTSTQKDFLDEARLKGHAEIIIPVILVRKRACIEATAFPCTLTFTIY